MPNDISRTSIPNELAILTELMLSHHIVKLDDFFISFPFLFRFFVFLGNLALGLPHSCQMNSETC